MSSDKHAFSFHHQRLNLVFEVRNGTSDSVFKALAHGHILNRNVAISGVLASRVNVILFHLGRTNVETSAPDVHLLVAILLCCFLLVEARECSIVAFVQSPRLNYGQPFAFHHLKRNLLRVDGAFQVRRVAHIEVKSGLFHQFASAFCLCLSLFRQFHVYPTRKQVLLVPLAFAVANNH